MTAIRTTPVSTCPVCGGSGAFVHRDVRDRVFQVPGVWSLRCCDGCRSLWLDPRPVDADLHLAYASYFTHERSSPLDRPGLGPAVARRVRIVRDAGTDDFIARRFDYPRTGPAWAGTASLLIRFWPGRRLDAEFKLMRLHGRDRGRLLDVGCGSGDALAALREREWDVRGVDFDADAVAVARERGLCVDHGSLEAQSYPDQAFDVVSMSHSLEHVANPMQVLGEVRRILRPGGRLVVLTPNADSWLHHRYGADWQPLEVPRHLQIFTRPALADLSYRAGFVEIEATTTPRAANGVARAAWKFRRDGRWDMQSRPSLTERIVMEAMQQREAWKVRRDPEAGEELVLTAINGPGPIPTDGPRVGDGRSGG